MTARAIVHVALFAAIIGALGLMPPIAVPFVPVPITAQTLGVMLAGAILGPRRGALAVILFVALVAAGLPLLAGGRGGLAVFASPTVGFLVGFIPGAFVTGLLVDRFWRNLNVATAFAAAALGGVVTVYLFGIPGLALVTGMSLPQAAAATLAFVPGDLIKAGVAAVIVMSVRRGYPAIREGAAA